MIVRILFCIFVLQLKLLQVSAEVDMLMVSTETKNARAILHFYLDEVGM